MVGVEEFGAELEAGEVEFVQIHHADVAVEHRADVDLASAQVGGGGELGRGRDVRRGDAGGCLDAYREVEIVQDMEGLDDEEEVETI